MNVFMVDECQRPSDQVHESDRVAVQKLSVGGEMQPQSLTKVEFDRMPALVGFAPVTYPTECIHWLAAGKQIRQQASRRVDASSVF